MNINELLINIQLQTGGLAATTSDWTDWMNLILGFAFAGLACLMIWIYYVKKNQWDNEKPEFDKFFSGSFKGFWLRYRGAIVAFLAAVFVIFAISFVLVGIFGYEIIGLGEGGST